jgi:DNA-binding CsgD family transcriptional regulator
VTADGPLATVADPDVPERYLSVWDEVAGENPLILKYVRTRDGRPYRFSDVVSAAELRSLRIYQEFYRPLGVEHQIAFTLPAPAWLTIGIALSRGGPRDFSDAERDMLALTRPHLIQAYRNAELRERLVGLVDRMARGTDAAGVAMVVLDERGRAEFVSGAAGELAPALRVGERMPSIDGLLVRRLTGPGRGTSVVLLDHPDRVLSPSGLRALGLTSREAEVLHALAAGASTGQAAASLAMSPRTLHKHTQRIYTKLGVRDRAQAIATAWAAQGVGS